MIVQLSDLHLGAAGAADPVEDARAAVAMARALRPDAVLVTGDLAEHAAAAEYAVARDLLAAAAVPVHVVAGNHDAGAGLHAAFPLAGVTAGPYRWAARLGPVHVVACDTSRPGRDDGQLAPAELDWLRERLAAEPDVPTIVAMHHPPLPTGMAWVDDIGLPPADRAALADVLQAAPQVQRVVTGHVHMAVHGRLGGATVSTGPSTWRDRPVLAPGADPPRMAPAPAELLVHVLVEGELVTHVQPVAAAT